MSMLRIATLLSAAVSGSFYSVAAYPADLPLYVEYIPFAPPNLHLQTDRVPAAFYNPSQTSGTTINYVFPVTTFTSLAQGPIPITLGAFGGATDCPGLRDVEVSLDFIIGGVATNIGTVTQTVDVVLTPTVPLFDFNGITANQVYSLDVGDSVRLQITNVTPGTNIFCLVNEFPLGGTDADASRVVLQTGPLLNFEKSLEVINDPINGTLNPKAIPGATIRYSITIENDPAASAAADNAVITDEMPADVTYSFGDNLITLDGVPQTDASDAPTDSTDFGVTTANTITATIGTLAVGEQRVLTYDVVLN